MGHKEKDKEERDAVMRGGEMNQEVKREKRRERESLS